MLGTTTGDVLVYLFKDVLLPPFCIRRIKASTVFRILKEESTTRPLTTCCVTRMLVIPHGLKDLILALLNVSACGYFVTGFFNNVFFSNLFCLISEEVNDVVDLNKKPKNWNEMSGVSQLVTVLTYTTAGFTFCMVVFLSVWMYRRIKAFRKLEEAKTPKFECLNRETEALPVDMSEGL